MDEHSGRVKTTRRDDGTIVLEGELDAFGADAIEQALAELEAGGDQQLDVSGVSFIDSAALRVLLRHRDRLHSAGGQLRLVDPHTSVRRLLDLSGLAEVLPVNEDADEPASPGERGDVSR